MLANSADALDQALPLRDLSRQMLVALTNADAPKVLSKIGLAQAIYALQTAIDNVDANPLGLYEEGIDICTTFPHINRRFRLEFIKAVAVHRAMLDGNPCTYDVTGR